MAYFPFFMDIKNKKCLVAGGGNVALRKIEVLSRFECHITVVSPRVTHEISDYTSDIILRDFLPEDVIGADFVIGATDSYDVNMKISEICHNADIPVNTVDIPEGCSFFFPAVYKDGDVVVGVSTGGKSPLVAQKIRRTLEQSLPKNLGKAANDLGELREAVKAGIVSQDDRKKAFEEIFELIINDEVSEAKISEIIGRYGQVR